MSAFRLLRCVTAAAAIGAGLALLFACRDAPSPARGRVLVVATTADADNLFPPLVASTQGLEITDLLFQRLAEPDSSLNIANDRRYRPALADRWSWSSDSLSIAFHVDPRARWHDGRHVTAADVQFTFAIYRDTVVGSPNAQNIASVDSVTVRDSATAVFWFHERSLEAFFTATYQMRILPKHVLDTIPRVALRQSGVLRHPIGSGPYRLTRWDAGRTVELSADTIPYHGTPQFQRVIFSITPDATAALTRVIVGEADFVEFLRVDDVARVRADSALATVPWGGLSNVAMYFNLRAPGTPTRVHAVLGQRDVRRALALAIDRSQLASSILGPLAVPARGPAPAILLHDVSLEMPLYAPQHAAALLDSAGWRLPPGAIVRTRAGIPLRFSILVPASGTSASRAAVQLQEMLRRVGVQLDIEPIEVNAQINRLVEGRFDATILSLDWDPSPNTIRQLWSSQAVSPHGSNFGGYRNVAFDAAVDSATRSRSASTSHRFLHDAWQTLVDDAPAVWLYDQVNIGVRRRTIEPEGVRRDAWWADIAAWRSHSR